MPLLTDATAIYVGDTPAQKVYLGDTLVWSGFSLSDIPGMTLWVEADDCPQTTDGPIEGGVAPTRVGPPLYATAQARIVMNGPGGRKAFDFTTENLGWQWLDCHGVTLGPDLTMFAVVNAGAQAREHADLVDFSHASGGGWVVQQSGWGPDNSFFWRVNNQYHEARTGPYPGRPHIVEVFKEGAFASLDIHGNIGSVTGAAGMDMTGGQFRIGNWVSGDRQFVGQISMIAAWPRALTQSERDQVRQYLVDGWAIQPWQPSGISGLTAWLDASDVGAVASVWPDKSGHGNHGTVVGTPSPTVEPNAPTGLSVVRFRPGQGRIRGTIPDLTTDFTVVYVARLVATPGRVFGTTLEAGKNYWVGFHGTGLDGWMYGPGYMFLSPVPYGTLPSPWKVYTVSATVSGGSQFSGIYANGSLLHSYSGGPVDLGPGTTYNLSGYEATGANETSDSEVGELLIYNRGLLDSERRQVEQYLAAKWS